MMSQGLDLVGRDVSSESVGASTPTPPPPQLNLPPMKNLQVSRLRKRLVMSSCSNLNGRKVMNYVSIEQYTI